MWIRKLSAGVLRVVTPIGPRYIRPSFSQRLHLLWIFRHFEMLPLQVLSSRQRALIDSLCLQQRFLSVAATTDIDDSPVLGTVERRPPIEVELLPPRRPIARVTEAVARIAQQRF
jgi:hypothetical protein